MATIEERAEKIVRTANSVWYCPGEVEECVIQQEIELAINVATEQDKIARQEERERCIKAVKDGFCLATCKMLQRHSTCATLGPCKEYNNFCELLHKVLEGDELNCDSI